MIAELNEQINNAVPLEGDAYIGIDIGTTSISAAVTDGKETRTFSIPNGCARPLKDGIYTQDAPGIAARVKEIADALIDRFGPVKRIGFDGQMHGIVYVDADGRAVSDLVTWQDGRGDMPRPDGETPCEKVKRLTGRRIYTGYGLATHIYNAGHDKVPADAVRFCTIGDYACAYLCGVQKPLIHTSNAASLGLFDVKNACFDAAAIDALGVGMSYLPDVSDKVRAVGEYRGIPVNIAVGDNQAAYRGVMPDGGVLCNFGTGSQISVAVDEYAEPGGGIECRPYFGGKYLLSGSALCGGRAYAARGRFFRLFAGTDEPQYRRLDELAEQGYSSGEYLDVSTLFSGTRDDPSLRGSIVGIDESNFTPSAMAYGFLRGMVGELYGYYAASGLPAPASVTASGNAVRKGETLRKVISDVFGCPVRVSDAKEEAACGAALLAMSE